MKSEKTAVLLMNVGSPDRPSLWPVWKYLSRFLNDKYVIDLPWLLRKFLVNMIIIPFRAGKSTRLYKEIWTEKGSPLICYSLKMRDALQNASDNNYEIFLAMRYGKPDYMEVLQKIQQEKYTRLIVFPLYPQYALSTTGTALNAVQKEVSKRKMAIELIKIDQFYDHPFFIDAMAKQAEKYEPERFDHIVFTYHGLPVRQIEKCHPGIKIKNCNCHLSMPEYGHHCYRATCYATTRLLAERLGLKPERYSTSFQSRLSRNWMKPFTDKVLLSKLKEGKKRILVIAPSFVTDCLETIYEINKEYRNLFTNAGGEELQLVEGLNSHQLWIEAMKNIIKEALGKNRDNSH
jgi:protoporphyrin/coproporphyrin ferrochelatase